MNGRAGYGSTFLIAGLLLGASPGPAERKSPGWVNQGDVMRGWRMFHEKGCVSCHAVWNQGGRLGPDLGRIRTDAPTPATLAGIMWNHIPKMHGEMRQSGMRMPNLTADEMADLFALIFFVRQLDEPGDPVRGEEILQTKGCSRCHETGETDKVGPDLTKWARYPNPIAWAQLMWEHAPVMEQAMQRSGISWPKLEGSDLVHIVAYVRSTGATGEKVYLQPGSVPRGAELFEEKECNGCHPGAGPDLSAAKLPLTGGALASRMWNHSPEMARTMAEHEVGRMSMDAQELADIVAYLLTLRHRDQGGVPERGRGIFTAKGCVECHERDPEPDTPRPSLSALEKDATPVRMAAAMWNHGETMLQRMTEAGLSWPTFEKDEMNDLLTYLASVSKAESRAGE